MLLVTESENTQSLHVRASQNVRNVARDYFWVNHQAYWAGNRESTEYLPDKGGLPNVQTPLAIKLNPREDARWVSFTDLNNSTMKLDIVSPSAILNKTTTPARAGYVFATANNIIEIPDIKTAPW